MNNILKQSLSNLERKGWKLNDDRIVKTFIFPEFKDVISFMSSAVEFIDTTNHHPEWKNIYNKLFVELTTHNEGGITELDVALAEYIEDHFQF